jgi:hypothetical protein
VVILKIVCIVLLYILLEFMIIFESQVILSVDSVNSYIAWDFSLVQGKINMVLLLQFFVCVYKLS